MGLNLSRSVKTIVIEYVEERRSNVVPVTTLDNTGGPVNTARTYKLAIQTAGPNAQAQQLREVTLKDAAGNVNCTERSGKFTIYSIAGKGGAHRCNAGQDSFLPCVAWIEPVESA